MTQEQKGRREVPGYQSYLLRLWREKGSASIQWRASLQDPYSGERVGFARLDELVAFLSEQIDLASPAQGPVEAERSVDTGSPSEKGGSE